MWAYLKNQLNRTHWSQSLKKKQASFASKRRYKELLIKFEPVEIDELDGRTDRKKEDNKMGDYKMKINKYACVAQVTAQDKLSSSNLCELSIDFFHSSS